MKDGVWLGEWSDDWVRRIIAGFPTMSAPTRIFLHPAPRSDPAY
jgi:hypothetical protein